jgi:hypothetical protein
MPYFFLYMSLLNFLQIQFRIRLCYENKASVAKAARSSW